MLVKKIHLHHPFIGKIPSNSLTGCRKHNIANKPIRALMEALAPIKGKKDK